MTLDFAIDHCTEILDKVASKQSPDIRTQIVYCAQFEQWFEELMRISPWHDVMIARYPYLKDIPLPSYTNKDEAIDKAIEDCLKAINDTSICQGCCDEYIQLAQWLKDLKDLRVWHDIVMDKYPNLGYEKVGITLDEAIEHTLKIANRDSANADWRYEHRQIARWLDELRERRSGMSQATIQEMECINGKIFYNERITSFLLHNTQIQSYYPDFDQWLEKVWEDVRQGINGRKVYCAMVECYEAGVLILKHTKDEAKICTLIVGKDYKGENIGSRFMGIAIRELGDNPSITIPPSLLHEYEDIIRKYEFVPTGETPNKDIIFVRHYKSVSR